MTKTSVIWDYLMFAIKKFEYFDFKKSGFFTNFIDIGNMNFV